MNTNLTPQDLIAFEERIAELFKQKKIRTIIHLYSGGEENMIKYFENVKSTDWVMCSWRSHYQCLLKGVPAQELEDEIVAGKSIALCFPDYRIVSSGIVGGILPIAVGVAMGIKLRGGTNHVHCFVGDMTAETGIAHESMKYAAGHKLPITFYVEDNGKSVCTDTKEVWGDEFYLRDYVSLENVVYSRYTMEKFPHAGAGDRIQF